ncbi:AAA family ATPase [Streptomyces sp. NPDC001137]|uniref:helix-turn-helix transcriptional regulator n=1 Tax=Streptomyces sp. NPDC001137 TaxID=3154378 RepID=UPI00332C688A
MDELDLVGRDTELRTLAELVGRLPEGGGALVIAGAAGIGKSSLLRAAVRLAREAGTEVLETTGAECEARLPYAGLHQLLRPLVGTAEALPAPQRGALMSAFGAEDGPPPEPFLIALAALGLLAGAAAVRPVLVAVDDVQWLDHPTQEALAFIARRVGRDPLAVVGTVRAGHTGPFLDAGVPELTVTALDDTAARRLLDAGADDLPPAVRQQILREALGNPLALVELPTAWRTRPPLAGGDPVRLLLPLTDRLERAFAGRVLELPQPTRDAVLVAAVDYEEQLPEILAAASLLAGHDLTVQVLGPAAAAGLLHFDEARLRFRHPLVRSAVLQSEPSIRRLAANAALADVLVDEPYRRTWHRAQSIVGPDDQVADELEASHTVSLRRGSVTAAIWALERSAQLSTGSATRGRRLLLAAEHAFGLGRADLVDRLVTAAERTALSELDRARMAWLREIFEDGVPGDAVRVFELCAVAERSAAAGDRDLALNLLLGAALRCWWAETGPEARARVVAVTEALPGALDDPRGIAAVGVAEPLLRGRAVRDLLTRAGPARVTDPDQLRLLGMAAHAVGDLTLAVDLLGRAELKLREQGRLGLLSHVLSMQIGDHLWLGDWERAATAAEEGLRVARDTGQPIWSTGSRSLEAIAAGLRGQGQHALELAAVAEAAAHDRRLNNLLACVQLAKGLTWLTAGRPHEAYDELCRLFDPADPSHHRRECFDGVMFLAEAAAQSGHREQARAVIAGLEEVAELTSAPLLHVQLAHARAVLADDADAEKLYLSALRQDLGRWPLVRAKTELAYGSWLRRHRRAVEARGPLRSARTTLDLIGASAWADQARGELRATGERVADRTARVQDALSPQELQIARLAAEGLSNRQIGERLCLSPRTIGSHLYRVFPKLGITSRAQLASRLGPGVP